MDDYLTPPPGWYFAAFPWHAMDDIPELPKLIRFGPVFLPEFFHLVIATSEEMGRGITDDPAKDYGAAVSLFLNFQVFEEEVAMVQATTAWEDISVVFEKVRKVVPSKHWKSIGRNYITRYLTRFMEEGGRPDVDPHLGPGWHWPDHHPESTSPYEFRPKEALAWLDQLQSHAAEAYATARDRPSPRKKRTRITKDFLKEVANIYRMAENSDQPPTREVANYYKAPHSTAAKWVATARRQGFLPPAADASNEAARAAVSKPGQ